MQTYQYKGGNLVAHSAVRHQLARMSQAAARLATTNGCPLDDAGPSDWPQAGGGSAGDSALSEHPVIAKDATETSTHSSSIDRPDQP